MLRNREAQRRFGWLWAAVLAFGVSVLFFGFRSGICIDYAVGVPAQSECFTGPDPSAVVLGGVALLFALYAVYRFFGRRT